ncbi:MAG: DUF4089 domain-containing protein [Novosphingobium sp.]|jgi:hypothetical protein|nr:DUF4089 domain-containing protein [Novosphingobium sp.]
MDKGDLPGDATACAARARSIDLDIPAVCMVGVLANLAVLQTHIAIVRAAPMQDDDD